MRYWHESVAFLLPAVEDLARSATDGGRRVRLTDGDDTYQAGDGGEYILGLGGSDRISGGQGDDTIKGGKGADSIGGFVGDDVLFGGAGDDALAGGAGQDALYGGNGVDDLNGGNRGDVVCGGAGADQLDLGGSGFGDFTDGARDTLLYLAVSDSTATATDRVFSFGVTTDRVNLGAIDADVSTSEDDAFHFIGKQAFSGVAGVEGSAKTALAGTFGRSGSGRRGHAT